MTVAQLIYRLQQLDPGLDVMVLDGGSGSGHPRDLTFGPIVNEIKEADEENSGDCDGRLGEKVVILGHG